MFDALYPALAKVVAVFVVAAAIILTVQVFWRKRVMPKVQRWVNARKGAIGERRVAAELSAFTQADGYHTCNDLLFRNPDAQIDFALFSPYGIFVIEVKTLGGKIYVDKSDRMWTQYLGKSENPFPSPIKQNFGHMMALHEITGLPKKCFHSLVVMAGDAVIKSEMPRGVIYLHEVRRKINSYKQRVLSDAQINDAVAAVLKAAKTDLGSRKKHIDDLRRRHG